MRYTFFFFLVSMFAGGVFASESSGPNRRVAEHYLSRVGGREKRAQELGLTLEQMIPRRTSSTSLFWLWDPWHNFERMYPNFQDAGLQQQFVESREEPTGPRLEALVVANGISEDGV